MARHRRAFAFSARVSQVGVSSKAELEMRALGRVRLAPTVTRGATLALAAALLVPPLAAQLPAADEAFRKASSRSEEHTSELQSPCNLVCRLLLEKKKKKEQSVVVLRHHSRAPGPSGAGDEYLKGNAARQVVRVHALMRPDRSIHKTPSAEMLRSA